MMLYRAHRDIHSQLPPESLSVSLNIMDEGEHVPWRDQYIVDLEAGTIAKRPTLTSGEMLLRCAVHLTDNGKDIAEQFAKAHPVPRVRANRSEEHTSELQSLMRTSYAVFCLKTK